MAVGSELKSEVGNTVDEATMRNADVVSVSLVHSGPDDRSAFSNADHLNAQQAGIRMCFGIHGDLSFMIPRIVLQQDDMGVPPPEERRGRAATGYASLPCSLRSHRPDKSGRPSHP